MAHALCLRENLQLGYQKKRGCGGVLDKLHAGTPESRDTNQLRPEPARFYNLYKPLRQPVICSTGCNLLHKYAQILHACLLSARISILQQ